MDTTLDIFADYARSFEARREADMSVAEYLEACRTDPGMYASAPERILRAIGEPDEIAGAAVFLSSAAGSFMTGQSMVIDGGTLAGVAASPEE